MALDDNEDEWDRKIKDALRYSVRLLIRHPSIDPDRITNTLQLKPHLSAMVGHVRKTPVGTPLPGLHTDSVWSYRFRTQRNRFFFSDALKMIERLEPHRSFLHELVDSGGAIFLGIHLPGDTNIGDVFSWRDMARLSALRIDLSIEVFPKFN